MRQIATRLWWKICRGNGGVNLNPLEKIGARGFCPSRPIFYAKYSPPSRWFEKSVDSDTGRDYYKYKGGYWESRGKNWEDCVELFRGV